MPLCAVPGCEKKRALTYRVPFENRELCQKWLSAIRNQNQDQNPAADLLKNLRVCSHHFTPDCFRPNLKLQLVGIKAKPELKDDAVPSLFPWSSTAEPEPPFQKVGSEESSPGKKYSKEDLACALSELETGGSLRRVGIKYGIPHTTLRDYKKKRYAHNPHPNRALTPEEEKALVNYILWRSEHGFPVTRAVVRTLALNIIKSSQRSTLVNLDKGLSAMWWSRFRARHPELNSRTPAALDQMEVQERPPQSAEGLLNICEPLYEKHGLQEKPHLIFNCGELGFEEKDLSRMAPEPVQRQQNFCGERITVHCCVSASGESIPPFIIYPRCLPSTAYALEGPPSALYALSPKGSMNGVLFLEWLAHFIKHAPAERPLLLFLDQHESHVSKEVVDVCRGNTIEVVCLPANSTLLLQPPAASMFGSLQAAFVAEASRIGLVNGGVVLKRHFSAVLKHAYDQAVTPDMVRGGFRRTGLYPLSRMVLTLTPSDPLDPSSISRDQTPLPSSPSGSETSKQRSQNPQSLQTRVEDLNTASPLSDSSGVEENSWTEDDQGLQMYQGASIFRSSEVMVNTQCLMELFRFCSVCLVECSVSVEGHEKLFSVTQACQSCGYHREWSNHPTTAKEPEEMINTEHEEEVEEGVREPE